MTGDTFTREPPGSASSCGRTRLRHSLPCKNGPRWPLTISLSGYAYGGTLVPELPKLQLSHPARGRTDAGPSSPFQAASFRVVTVEVLCPPLLWAGVSPGGEGGGQLEDALALGFGWMSSLMGREEVP